MQADILLIDNFNIFPNTPSDSELNIEAMYQTKSKDIEQIE